MNKTNISILIFSLFSQLLFSQQRPLDQSEIEVFFESGTRLNETTERNVIFSEAFKVPKAKWLRLYFSEVVLGTAPMGGQETTLKITSVKDGASQILDTRTLGQWRNSSAYFNGNEVIIEIISDPRSAPSFLKMNTVIAGEQSQPLESICGTTDNRELSSDPKTARIMPIGCTGWIIDDANHCFLTAGHCAGGIDVIEFNVPLSDSNGTVNHPPPEDQYPADPDSLQADQTVIGNDWAYFGCFPNSNTGLTAFEAQNDFFVLGTPPGSPGGEIIRITGYGTTTATNAPNTWSQVQTTHNGELVIVSGTILRYTVDTTGGDSGSAVLNEDTGEAIGIHTNAGCSSSGGSNQATSLDNTGLLNALANPLGVCAPPPPLEISFPNGVPELVSYNGEDIQIQILPINGGQVQAGTAKLTYDIGAGNVDVTMTSLGDDLYQASFPPLPCLTDAHFFISVSDIEDVTVQLPKKAPEVRFFVHIASDFDQSFRDNFETDKGWAVNNDSSLSSGAWERGTPVGGGLRNDPAYDVDGGGKCYITQNASGDTDLDGGHTVLLSPLMDASEPESHISYWRWWSDTGSSVHDDTFVIQISDDDGSTWTTVETIGPDLSGSWEFAKIRIADFVTPNDQFRIRFDASDTGSGSVVEAGIDHVALYNSTDGFLCGCVATTITKHPEDVTTCLAGTATFSIESGPGLSYQWLFGGSEIQDATESTLILSQPGADDVGAYSCVVTNNCATSLESDSAQLTLVEPLYSTPIAADWNTIPANLECEDTNQNGVLDIADFVQFLNNID